MYNWTALDWDLDNAMTALKAAMSSKNEHEYKDAIVHLDDVIYSAKEAIERLEKGEK